MTPIDTVADAIIGNLVDEVRAYANENKALEARVADLEADPRMGITQDDLSLVISAFDDDYSRWQGQTYRRFVSVITGMARAALAAEKGEGHGA